jgi:hypothetical protein
MAGVTEVRILQCVPRFLSETERFQILCFYIPSFAMKVLQNSTKEALTLEALPRIYGELAGACRKSTPELGWFVSGIFSPNELNEFAAVLQYAYLERLCRSYQAVAADVHTIISELGQFDGITEGEYSIAFLGQSFPLKGNSALLSSDVLRQPQPPSLVSKFSHEYSKILAEHQVDAEVESIVAGHSQTVARIDLSALSRTVKQLPNHQIVDCYAVIRGAGGTAKISLSRRSLGRLRYDMCYRVAVALLITLLLLGAGGWLMLSKNSFQGLFCFGLFPAFAAVAGVWEWANQKRKELREYERKQRSWIAAR